MCYVVIFMSERELSECQNITITFLLLLNINPSYYYSYRGHTYLPIHGTIGVAIQLMENKTRQVNTERNQR